MDDKTSSMLQASTPFDDTRSSTTDSSVDPLTSSTSLPSTSINAIISTASKANIMEQKNQSAVASLMSPLDINPLESFPRMTVVSPMDTKSQETNTANASLPSPPVSPGEKAQRTTEDLTGVRIRDPILFDSGSSSSSQPPLFTGLDDHQRQVVQDHIAARPIDSFRVASPPLSSEYQLALEFKSKVAQQYMANRRAWRQRETAQLAKDMALKSGRRYPTIAPAHAGGRPVRPGGKIHITKTGPKSEKIIRQTTIKPRGGTPDRRVAREDKDFKALDDFCPPISSLPNRPNSLKVDWRGAPIDLRSDTNYNLLHPDEVALAANLRLDCATYLTSKRRIFIKRVECIRICKEFRKTDAQQACKIDVNKASKLWTAFDKVGWLQPKWVQQHV